MSKSAFTCAALRNPDVEVKTVLAASHVSHYKVYLQASLFVLGGLENT